MAYTTIDNPGLYFNTLLWTGDGTGNRSLTGVGFQPDWVWTKLRSTAGSHQIYDIVRGATKDLEADNTNAESTSNEDGFLNSFDSDGFTMNDGSSSDFYGNDTGKTYVAWNWKAGGTAPAITYVVKVVSDSGNKYRFDDYGTSAVTLDLQEGGTYTFDQSDSSNSGHPLRFYTASDKSGGEYTTGVTTTGTAGSSGAKTVITVAASAPTLYYQCSNHAGMGGQANTNSTFGSSNFGGSIQSTVSANTTAGFSIVKVSKSNTNVATIGHGLGVTPKFIIGKDLDSADNWTCYSESIGNDKGIYLNATNTEVSASTFWNSTSPTSSVFTIGSDNTWNSPSILYYCFADVKGYSKFGSYVGNGSTSGTYVHLGFKPAFVLSKHSTGGSVSAENWNIYDTARDTFNVIEKRLMPNSSNAESSGSNDYFDILSNGFKLRNADGRANNSGATYIYWAFAESPFVNSKGIPTNAR